MKLKKFPKPIEGEWSIWDYGDHWLINNETWGIEFPKNHPDHERHARAVAAVPEMTREIDRLQKLVRSLQRSHMQQR